MADSAGPSRQNAQVALQPRVRAASLPSGISAIIPQMVRSRLPVFASIRRSGRPAAVRRPLPHTPFIPDEERIQELGGSSSRSSSAASSVDGAEPKESVSVLGFGASVSDTRSGVNWDTSSTGVRLWLSARSQAANNPNVDPALLRQMHIDAVKYMNMALPQELSALEVRQLSRSLPHQLQIERSTTWASEGLGDGQTPLHRNILRRSISQVVCLILAIVALLVPYLINLLNAGLRYERRHHVSERLLANGIVLADVLGDKGIDVRDAMVRFGSGRVGASIAGLGIWVVDGVIGGVTDGITEVQKPTSGG